MIDGNPNDFLNSIYSGQDTVFVFKGVKYWAQGYNRSNGGWHYEIIQVQPPSENRLWMCDTDTIDDCFKAFIEAPIFGMPRKTSNGLIHNLLRTKNPSGATNAWRVRSEDTSILRTSALIL